MSTYVIHPTDEQEKVVKAFLEALDIDFVKDDDEELPQYVLDGIARGQADFKAGRTMSLENFRKKMLHNK